MDIAAKLAVCLLIIFGGILVTQLSRDLWLEGHTSRTHHRVDVVLMVFTTTVFVIWVLAQ